MTTSTDPLGRRRLYAAIAAGIALLVLAGVGVYGLITGPRPATTPTPLPSTPVPAPSPSPPQAAQPPGVTGASDPEVFARNVAMTLFTWDTASGHMPLDYAAVILAVGDPSGTEQAGLASDLAGYLPSRESWIELRTYSTSQTLTIATSVVPAAWDEALAQAQPGQLPTGATAITIDGTRHRAGIWNGVPVSEDFPVAFTVFLACPPGVESCHLLRLSQLDNPLR